MKKNISLLVLIVSCTQSFAGSGWVKKKGETYLKLNQYWVTSQGGYFDADGVLDPFRQSSLFTTSLYGETGLSEGWSFEFYVPLFSTNTLSISDEMGNEIFTDKISGIGDLNLGVKQLLVNQDAFALSATYMLGLPLGLNSGGDDGTLFTGDGELNANFRLDAGIPFGLGKFGGYFNANVGYNMRSTIFSNEFAFGTELGLSAFESKFWIITRLNGIEATKTGANTEGNLFASNVNFVNYSVEANMYLSNELGLSVNYVGNVSGANVLITPAYNVGLFLDLK